MVTKWQISFIPHSFVLSTYLFSDILCGVEGLAEHLSLGGDTSSVGSGT